MDPDCRFVLSSSCGFELGLLGFEPFALTTMPPVQPKYLQIIFIHLVEWPNDLRLLSKKSFNKSKKIETKKIVKFIFPTYRKSLKRDILEKNFSFIEKLVEIWSQVSLH